MLLFFFNDTATTEIYTLSLHDALPILRMILSVCLLVLAAGLVGCANQATAAREAVKTAEVSMPPSYRFAPAAIQRSEEHTSELQSRQYLVCRLLLEKKNISRTRP